MSLYTASGARREGDEYQDLLSAEILVAWLEDPDVYLRVRLEVMDGSLDDIQVDCADGTRLLLQVKFATDPSDEWHWEDLLKQPTGRVGPRPSLLQKWKTSLDDAVALGVAVKEAALLTNRMPDVDFQSALSSSGFVEFDTLAPHLQTELAFLLGGEDAAAAFLRSFRFIFREPAPESLRQGLQQRFRRIGGSTDGWHSLMANVRRWINRRDEPTPDGTIRFEDVRIAALWHVPPSIPEDFDVPEDYVCPELWSHAAIESQLHGVGDQVLVVTGSPGVGKSTYLSWLVDHLRQADVPVVRHHYYLSMTDRTVNRGGWETASSAIMEQLHRLYPDLVREVTSVNPLPDALPEFLAAAGRARIGAKPLVVIVDGIDHVWRDQGAGEDLRELFDLLLPVPDGLVVIVGTQSVDAARLPKKLRDHCPRDTWLELPVLDQAGVYEWLKHHQNDLDLPEDPSHKGHVLAELAHALHDVSGGQPLLLTYTWGAAQRFGPTMRPDQVRTLPSFNSQTEISSYYSMLWDSIGAEGHQLLHLLAAFPWAWPHDGLAQCLALNADYARLELAKNAIRHLLGTTHAGMTAFHESLLAFVRGLPEHAPVSDTLRPQVIAWLSDRAPEYWRWRYAWQERANSGDPEALLTGPTLGWCVDSLVAGRGREDLREIVAGSGWAALRAGRLGVATERHYLDVYLAAADDAEGALARLIWLAFRSYDATRRNQELNLFLSRLRRASDEQLEAVVEVAYASQRADVCDDLLAAAIDRWNIAVQRPNWTSDRLKSLQRIVPATIAANLATPSQGLYQRYLSGGEGAPPWCPTSPYVAALTRCCAIGYETAAVREELRFLANYENVPSFEAVDEIVRLACREGFDPAQWICNSIARTSGLFNCYRLWLRPVEHFTGEPSRNVSFASVWRADYGQDQDMFVQLAHAYFFSCLASVANGLEPAAAAGVDPKASQVAHFLEILRDLAGEAADLKRAGQLVGGGWLVDRLGGIERPHIVASDLHDRLLMPGPLARIVVAIAQDLELLSYTATRVPSLTRQAVVASIESGWTWESIWINDRVDRRLPMIDAAAARTLIDRERRRLQATRDYALTRSDEYALLAQFCDLNSTPHGEVQSLIRLAARNAMGHGSHKDITLFDVLDAVRATADCSSASNALERLRAVSPVIGVADEITDGDETRHLPTRLASVIRTVAPQALADYLRSLQNGLCHVDVERCYTDLAKSLDLHQAYERSLAATLVHEDALVALQERADAGDSDAGSVLSNMLAHCRRQDLARDPSDVRSDLLPPVRPVTLPAVQDYSPERLPEFVGATRAARSWDDNHLAAWTAYWLGVAPDQSLDALAGYQAAHGHPLETETAKSVVELTLQRRGLREAWDCLVGYHEALSGWASYMYRMSGIQWMWQLVGTRYPSRWLEFIVHTARSRWDVERHAPGWSVFRLVEYLKVVGQGHRVDEVVDAAIAWARGLVADMSLPAGHLPADAPTPELPFALRLLVDRLDCPSRMVQERAAWQLAALFADSATQGATAQALLEWHARGRLELRSCMLLNLLHLAHAAHGVTADLCMEVARQAMLVSSIGADLLLREFGEVGAALAERSNYREQHSGTPESSFSQREDFRTVVRAHLAPIFVKWAGSLDRSDPGFARRWEWEAENLARQHDLALSINRDVLRYYEGGINSPTLEFNDCLSTLLRSAYMRALHWSIVRGGVDPKRIEFHARHVAVMADPTVWRVQSADKPEWWPDDPGDQAPIDLMSAAVGRAVTSRLEHRHPLETDILLFAAGPVGSRANLAAELEVRAFLQSAHGPIKPSATSLAQMKEVRCGSTSDRMWLPGTYQPFDPHAAHCGDWVLAPLAWRFMPDSMTWLLPERMARSVQVPASWLFDAQPMVDTDGEQFTVTVANTPVAHGRYWNDDLRERHFHGAPPRVGFELLLHREALESQLASGATLAWVVTLSVARRERFEERSSEPKVVGTWVFGGSHIVWPRQWVPPGPPTAEQ